MKIDTNNFNNKDAIGRSGPSVRPRQTNYQRSLRVVKDIKEFIINNNNQNQNQNSNQQNLVSTNNNDSEKNEYEIDMVKNEIKQINDLYDKKRSILIPKTKKKQGPNISLSEEYKPTIFERPSNYIVYGERKKVDIHSKFKEYESNANEIDCMKKIEIPLNAEEYEQIIINLEDDVGKGEMIPRDRAYVVIESKYPNLTKFHMEKIYNVSSENFNE